MVVRLLNGQPLPFFHTPGPSAAQTALASEPVEITWFVGLGMGSETEQIVVEQALVDAFNATHENIELVLEVVPTENASETLAAQIAAGQGPDVIGPAGWPSWNSLERQWLDLTPYIDSTHFDLTQFDPPLVDMYRLDEGLVSLPFMVFPSMFWYLPDLFDAAGLNYPPEAYGEQYEMPDGVLVDWSWETVTEVARLLTIDTNGLNATQSGFNRSAIVQYGFSFGWEKNPAFWGSYWQGGTLVQGGPGAYSAEVPDAWQEAWQWFYDGMWGSQPFAPDLIAFNELNGGNVLDSGRVAMVELPNWYLCCLGTLTGSGRAFQFAAMPSYNGIVAGRIDADTFRIWSGSAHPGEAFEVLTYLITDGVDMLLIGTNDQPSVYGNHLPGIISRQQIYLDARAAEFPFVTQTSWNVMMDGLNYPDIPGAESFLPNWTEAWERLQTFGDLLSSTPNLDLTNEIKLLEADLTVIFNR